MWMTFFCLTNVLGASRTKRKVTDYPDLCSARRSVQHNEGIAVSVFTSLPDLEDLEAPIFTELESQSIIKDFLLRINRLWVLSGRIERFSKRFVPLQRIFRTFSLKVKRKEIVRKLLNHLIEELLILYISFTR